MANRIVGAIIWEDVGTSARTVKVTPPARVLMDRTVGVTPQTGLNSH